MRKVAAMSPAASWTRSSGKTSTTVGALLGLVGLALRRLAEHVADVELEPPAVAFLRDAVEFEGADLGALGCECHRHLLYSGPLAAAEDRVQRRQLQQ
jgi:hypothetical protein